jgi:competence protein ComEC
LDQIRQRLAEIDRQFDRNPAYYYKQSVSTAPLVFCAIGLIAGIIIQDHLPAPVWNRWLLLGFCTAILILSLIIYFFWPASETRKFYTLPLLATVIFACLGAIRLTSFNSALPNDIRNLVGSKSIPAAVRGVIVTEPYIDSNDWQFARFVYTDPGSSFYLRITDAETVNGWAKATGLVRVRVQEPVIYLKAGDYVQMYCWLDRFTGASNPGEFDIAEYLRRKGVFTGASVETSDAILRLQSNPSGAYDKFRGTLRKIATQALLGHPYPDQESEKLLLALVLGQRADIDKNITEAFRKTGLLHFICLSGMNFAIVIGFVWWVCKTAGLMKPGRAVVCMITAVLFLLVVPENPPAFRAAVMCFAFCGSFIFRRKSNPFNSLALAAVVLLLIRPTGLFEAGWQLSFASVLGILLFAKSINNFLHEKASDLFSEPDNPSPLARTAAKIGSAVSSVFAVSLAAWLSTAGIMLYHFYAIQWLTSFWTVLVSPLIGLLSFLGYLKLFVAMFLPSAAALLWIIVNFLSYLLIVIVKFLADLNISEILIGKTNVTVILLFYGLIVFAFFFRLRFKKAICVTAALTLVAIVVIPRWQTMHCDGLTITALDVGHGQAVLAQLPGGSNILFDAGSLNRSNIGAKVVLPFLRYSAIGKINAVVISHGDIDHINGIPEVAEDGDTKTVYANKAFLEDKRQTVLFLKKFTKVNDINELPKTFGSTTIKTLWPAEDIYKKNESDNDNSLVSMIEFADRRIIMCSDIEKSAQKEIIRLYPDLKADVLIAPHHGSIRTLDKDFLDMIKPDFVICSCDKTSFEKERVIGQNNNFKTYYTGTDGAVTVRVSENGTVRAVTYKIKK